MCEILLGHKPLACIVVFDSVASDGFQAEELIS